MQACWNTTVSVLAGLTLGVVAGLSVEQVGLNHVERHMLAQLLYDWQTLVSGVLGGNATGINPMVLAPEGKRLSLLHELVPDASRIGVLFNPNSPDASSHLTDIETAGQSLGLDLVIVNVADESGFESAFAWISEQQIGALLVAADPLFSSRSDRVVGLASRYRVPAIYSLRIDAVAGGLMSYGPSLVDTYRQLGIYTGRVLKGEKPSDMPVWQAIRFELVINLKAANAIDLDISPSILARADEVIE
jgi:putative tryptophan/tyrosine transport system substrate-binding protein